MSIKILTEGQPCRNCGTPVIKRTHPEGWLPSRSQKIYFRWWFRCENCRTTYNVNAAKVIVPPDHPRAKPWWNKNQ